MEPVVAIIAAYNEAASVAGVVRPLLESGAFARVLVVDDGSTDGTADAARAAGAWVLALAPNRGKGGAMRAGVDATREPLVAFFDADLVGLHPEHVHTMLTLVARGAGQVVGLRDYGYAYNAIQPSLPLISGERVVRREILARVRPGLWSGFKIEAGINGAARDAGARTEAVVLPGLSQRTKWDKLGVRRGLSDGVKMLMQVLVAERDARSES